MVAVSMYHVGYLFTRRGRGWIRDMAPDVRDIRDVIGNGLYLVGVRKSPPAFERFSYIEKAEYWALVWGTVVMTVTGVALWFENQVLQVVNKWVLDLATIIHYYEAWLAFLAIVVWHLYQNIVNPDVYPMNWTWLTGRISEEQMQHEHGAEWARLEAEERAAREAAEREAAERERVARGPEGGEGAGI
jgi:cytochrome b subunit of formate dehydrogenase